MIELTTEVLFKIIGFIVRLAPLGVFGAIAYTVGKYGVGSLQQLGMLVVLYYATVAFFVSSSSAASCGSPASRSSSSCATSARS